MFSPFFFGLDYEKENVWYAWSVSVDSISLMGGVFYVCKCWAENISVLALLFKQLELFMWRMIRFRRTGML